MGISPWYRTSSPISPIWTILLVPDTGSFNVAGLAPSNFALLLRNLDTGVETTGQGTFSNIQAATTISPASVQYQLATADVNLGHFRVWVEVTLSTGGIEPF
ncbi:MAG TPA: hypothetical protein VFN23_10545, partial [Ktedonobacteraceae bacterium]|nr:hypothetical protein [Ktedonobacteraceae bacterium]